MRRKAKKRFNPQLVHTRELYSTKSLAELFQIGEGTVRRWRRDGLNPIDVKKPVRFYGSDIREFIKKRQNKPEWKCAPGEVFCVGCDKRRHPRNGEVHVNFATGGRPRLYAICDVCGNTICNFWTHKKDHELIMYFRVVEYEVLHLQE
jgi:hypothetical protein